MEGTISLATVGHSTIRCLPAGTDLTVLSVERRNDTIEVELAGAPSASDGLSRGTLVEVVTEKAIFLGPVLGRDGARIRVEVAHLLDRERLLRIQAAWGVDQSDAD